MKLFNNSIQRSDSAHECNKEATENHSVRFTILSNRLLIAITAALGISGCAGTNIGQFVGKKHELAEIERRLPDEEALAESMAYLIEKYFNTSNPRLMAELGNNYARYVNINNGVAAYSTGFTGKNYIDIGPKIKNEKKIYEQLLIHEMLHDLWDNYINQEQRDEVSQLTLTWHEKIMSPGYDKKDGMLADKLFSDTLLSYKELYSTYPNMDKDQLNMAIGNEMFAFVGSYLAKGSMWYVPPPFLKFYEDIVPASQIEKARKSFIANSNSWSRYELPLE